MSNWMWLQFAPCVKSKSPFLEKSKMSTFVQNWIGYFFRNTGSVVGHSWQGFFFFFFSFKITGSVVVRSSQGRFFSPNSGSVVQRSSQGRFFLVTCTFSQ